MNIKHDTETTIKFNDSHSSKITIKKDYNKRVIFTPKSIPATMTLKMVL